MVLFFSFLLLLVSRTAQRKWFVSFLNRRTPQEGEEQEEPQEKNRSKKRNACFNGSFLNRRTPLLERKKKNRSKKVFFERQLAAALFFCCLFQEFKGLLVSRTACFKNSKKRCFLVLLLVSRIQRNGFKKRTACFKNSKNQKFLFQEKEETSNFCLFVSRKEGFVSRTRRAAASCLFQEPLKEDNFSFQKHKQEDNKKTTRRQGAVQEDKEQGVCVFQKNRCSSVQEG